MHLFAYFLPRGLVNTAGSRKPRRIPP